VKGKLLIKFQEKSVPPIKIEMLFGLAKGIVIKNFVRFALKKLDSKLMENL
jgi:hypothetical protein